MSLVAYGASDDSDASDSEDVDMCLEVVLPRNGIVDDTKSDPSPAASAAEPEMSSSSNNNNDNSINNTDNAIDSGTDDDDATETKIVDDNDESINEDDGISGTISDEDEPSVLLKGLPAAKPDEAIKASLVVTEDDELEDLVKPKPSQLADISLPSQKSNKGRQPVKISIPALNTDSDEEDEPKRKKPKPSSSAGNFLTSLLPAPRHATTKETNRLLLPHILGKKPQQLSVKAAESSKSKHPVVGRELRTAEKVVKLAGVPDGDSDDEDSSSINFFSLDNNDSKTKSAGPVKTQTVSVAAATTTTPNVSSSSTEYDAGNTTVDVSSACTTALSHDVNETVSSSDEVTPDSPKDPDSILTNQDMPLSFKSQPTARYNPGTSLHYNYRMSRPNTFTHSIHQSQPSYVSYQGDVQEASVSQQPQEENYEEGESTQADVAQYLQDEEFLKLQGKKQRGREAVNIIDINTDEFISTKDVMKTLTVEQEHTAHRKKDNQPSSRSRHKHQITYLAFQAKERELDLKNQWSQNRQTKRQTQSKYGF